MSEEAPKYGVIAFCESPKEREVGGDHYRKMKIQPIEFITANNLGFCVGNIIKYVVRCLTRTARKICSKRVTT